MKTLAALLMLCCTSALADSPHSGQWGVVEENAIGCESEADFAALLDAIDAKDRAAFTAAALRCASFEVGVKVWVKEVHPAQRVMLVRPKAGLTTYWMPSFSSLKEVKDESGR